MYLMFHRFYDLEFGLLLLNLSERIYNGSMMDLHRSMIDLGTSMIGSIGRPRMTGRVIVNISSGKL